MKRKPSSNSLFEQNLSQVCKASVSSSFTALRVSRIRVLLLLSFVNISFCGSYVEVWDLLSWNINSYVGFHGVRLLDAIIISFSFLELYCQWKFCKYLFPIMRCDDLNHLL